MGLAFTNSTGPLPAFLLRLLPGCLFLLLFLQPCCLVSLKYPGEVFLAFYVGLPIDFGDGFVLPVDFGNGLVSLGCSYMACFSLCLFGSSSSFGFLVELPLMRRHQQQAVLGPRSIGKQVHDLSGAFDHELNLLIQGIQAAVPLLQFHDKCQ